MIAFLAFALPLTLLISVAAVVRWVSLAMFPRPFQTVRFSPLTFVLSLLFTATRCRSPFTGLGFALVTDRGHACELRPSC